MTQNGSKRGGGKTAHFAYQQHVIMHTCTYPTSKGGMQSGSPVGTYVLHKSLSVLGTELYEYVGSVALINKILGLNFSPKKSWDRLF